MLHTVLPSTRATAIGLVILTDFLSWDIAPGIGASLALLAGGLCLVARRPTLLSELPGELAAGLVLLAALAGCWDQGILPLTLGAAGLLALGLLAHPDAAPVDGVRLGERIVFALIHVFLRPLTDSALIHRWGQRHRASSIWWHGWIWPSVFAGVFIGLFTLANPLIAERLEATWAWLTGGISLPAPVRVVLWWAFALFAWLILRPRNNQAIRAAATNPTFLDRTQLVRRSLGLFHVLFFLQNGLDLTYLWGHAALPTGMTYAGYAHRGAYPLVATALLAAGFILAWFRPGSPVMADKLCRNLVIAWLVQNLVLLGSAAWRLDLYVDVYGLTRWRVAAGVWMVLVAGGLVLIGWRIFQDRRNRWLCNANAALVMTILAFLAWADVDGLIARHNLARTTTDTDLGYLESLGPAALPALRSAVAQGRRKDLHPIIDRLNQQLTADLTPWQAWTVRRAAWAAER